jgi:hypothetical protein
MAAAKARTSVASRKRISVLSMRGSRIPSQGDLINSPAWTAAFMIFPSICAAFVVVAGETPDPLSSATHDRTAMRSIWPSSRFPNRGST